MINGLVNCVENRGRRRKRKTFVYDGIHCVADINSAGSVIKSYTWGPGIDNLLAITCHSGALATTYYALTDLQGTVHGFADAGGNLVESYTYDAWGSVLTMLDGNGLPISNQQSQIQNRFLFQGREYSYATGLYNFRLRWYDPATGRWISRDPIGISGGLNLYAFCDNDPVNFRDPWGLCKEDEQSYDEEAEAQKYLNLLRRDKFKLMKEMYLGNHDTIYFWSTTDGKDLVYRKKMF